jgi:hypothetical protein
MGSWSVYCGISNITIHEGDEALLVPLEKAKENYNDFDQWKLATLPIFGSYNDYGEIEDIKKDFNTTLIENEYQCSIEEFCHCLIRSEIDGKDGQGNLTNEQAERICSLSYMWIKKDVWDLMTNYISNGYGRSGSLDFGNKKILDHLGIEYVGENKNDTRYNKLYKYGKQYFKSDGTFLSCCPKTGKTLTQTVTYQGEKIKCLSDKNKSIYRLKDLKEVLPDLDVSFFESKEKQHLLDLLDDFMLKMQYFSSLFNMKYLLQSEIRYLSLIKNISIVEALYNEDLKKEYLLPDIFKKYIELLYNNDSEILSIISKLITLKKNCYVFSKLLEPYVSCITPQCGEDEDHLNILKGFVKILEETILENNSDEEEE